MKDMVNSPVEKDGADNREARTSGPLSRFPRTTRQRQAKTGS